MRKNTYNPTRRNRNIGTSKSGYGQNNFMRIPDAWNDDRMFWSKVVDPVFINITVASVELPIIVEPVNSGFKHHVSPWDIERILTSLSNPGVDGLAAIVLRQPKKKEHILSSVWGRFIWYGDIGNAHGPMIVIEAQKEDKSNRWSKSLKPEAAKELDRLRADGHEITSDKRYHHIQCTIEAIRNTQLYRTLLHELGHYIDYRTNIADKDNGDIDIWFDLVEKYEQRTSDQKEQYAHKFAENAMLELKNSGLAPFDIEVDVARNQKNSIADSWFASDDV